MQSMIVAKAIILDEHGKILLLRRSPTDPRRAGEQDFPGGEVNKGEELTAGVAREIFEEAGLSIDLKNLHLFYAATEAYSDRSVTRLVFWTRVTAPEITLSDEHDDFHWVTAEEAAVEFPHPVYGASVTYALGHGLFENQT